MTSTTVFNRLSMLSGSVICIKYMVAFEAVSTGAEKYISGIACSLFAWAPAGTNQPTYAIHFLTTIERISVYATYVGRHSAGQKVTL